MDKPHKKLDVWRLAMDFAKDAYQTTQGFPKEERFGLTDQIRRAAVSIPSNIAEGAARQTTKEFVNYLHVARASLSEIDTQLELAKGLGYLPEKSWRVLDSYVERIDKMLSGLIRHQRIRLSRKEREKTSGVRA